MTPNRFSRLRRALSLGAAVIAGCALAACGGEGIEITQGRDVTQQNPVTGRPLSPLEKAPSTLTGEGGFGFGLGTDPKAAGATLPVNKYLWRATLDTLAAFLPLASTDPYGGVIVTDWGSTADAPNERFKVAAFITSAALEAQSLRVVVNREQRDASGAWVAATVADDTSRSLENAILTRARQLKVDARDDS